MCPHPCTRRVGLWAALLFAVVGTIAHAATPADAEEALRVGEYQRAIDVASAGMREQPGHGEWAIPLVKALLVLDRTDQADAAMRTALSQDPANIQLRWLARDVDLAHNRPDHAAQRLNEIRRLVAQRPWAYRAPPNLVIYGRTALLLGADPKDVLDKVYHLAEAADPKLREVYLARGELALDKHDYALAAKAFDAGLKPHADDPDLLCGRAQAYASSDREAAKEALASALKINPRHVPSLLQLIDRAVDAEAYDEADQLIGRVLAVNPRHPEAWAYRAVLAHLRADAAGEQQARTKALATWATNPRVDFLIGQKLAQKYRFADAAAAQRRALTALPGYLPASAELATDLLRLGQENEGWQLAQAVHERDEYDVQAYNLVMLRDTMAKYATLTERDFVVRMAAPEVAVYGPRVLALLRRAQQTLTAKYGVELAAPTYVEIFADQKDFAVRTFGLPDIPGFLGVCFGRVVTANSPAATTTPTNWEAVVWHEFCHVVTLQLTQNKMPRWLSEGISVYEEWQADPAWGMKLTPRYRTMVLGDKLTPVSQLSGAFLTAKSGDDVQFAYLESAMVIDYLVQRYGLEALRGVLRDLRDGMPINAALAHRTAPMPELERGFAAFATEQARRVGTGLSWEKPAAELLDPAAAPALAAWAQKHPDNYWVLRLQAAEGMANEDWAKARPALERLIALYPEQKGAESAYPQLVTVTRALKDTAAERATLLRWAAVDDEAPEAYLRLMQLAAAEKDWATVRRNGERYLAVNPLTPAPYRLLADACTATHDVSGAVVAWRTLLQLDPADPAEAHFQLARLLHERGDDGLAKREVLLALEDTPRFQPALHLLLEVERRTGGPAAESSLTPAPAARQTPAGGFAPAIALPKS